MLPGSIVCARPEEAPHARRAPLARGKVPSGGAALLGGARKQSRGSPAEDGYAARSSSPGCTPTRARQHHSEQWRARARATVRSVALLRRSSFVRRTEPRELA